MEKPLGSRELRERPTLTGARGRPMTQLASNPGKGRDSEEDWRWDDSALGSQQQTSRLAGAVHGGLSPAGGMPRVCKAEL